MTGDVRCDLCGRPIHRGELAARLVHPEGVACLQHIIPPERLPYIGPSAGRDISAEVGARVREARIKAGPLSTRTRTGALAISASGRASGGDAPAGWWR